MNCNPPADGSRREESRRSFLQVLGAAALVPCARLQPLAASEILLPAAPSPRSAAPPELLPIPEYMIYAQLPDRRLLGICGAPRGDRLVARTSLDSGATWGPVGPLFRLDPAVGGWALHNGFLDRAGELHLIFTNDAHTPARAKSLYDVHYDIWHARSRGGRATWVAPNLVWRGYAGSLLSFLQLSTGRIVLPFCYLTPRTWAHRGTGFADYTFLGRFSSTAAYSDDDGATWHASTSELSIPTPQIGDDGGIEPIVLERQDGSLWMLIRSQNDRFFESFSRDGAVWSHPRPTALLSSDSPCSLTRLRDGRVVMMWNNTQRFPYANGGRAVLHGAISEDDGRTWRGYREIARNPLAGEPPPPNGDHGVTYTVPALTAEGQLVTSLSTGPGGGTYLLRWNPEWLYETSRAADFSSGLDDWTSFGTHGVALEPHPQAPGRKVLAIKKPDSAWPAGTTWNFPAGRRGLLRLRIRILSGFAGALLGLTDHFSVPFDAQDRFWNVFNLDLEPGGSLHGASAFRLGQWYDLQLSWDCDRHSCSVSRDGHRLATLPMLRETPGPCYLRLRSTAPTVDRGGLQIESLVTDVSASWV